MPAIAARLFKVWTMKTGIRSGPLFLYIGKTRDEVLRDIQQRMDKKIGTFDND